MWKHSSTTPKAIMKTVMAVALCSLAILGSQAMAQQTSEGPWLVRVRAVNLDPANKSDPVGGTGASDRIGINSKTIPDVDISYFFTPNWATELVLTVPQKQKVYLDRQNIGSFKHLPPTLTLQYHFMPDSQFSPYLGAGVNYTRITSVDILNGNGRLDSSSTGLALQAGVDYRLNQKWSLNFDIKKLQIGSDVRTSAGKISNVQIDPWLIGAGVGYRF
jgi:outer membrane protein